VISLSEDLEYSNLSVCITSHDDRCFFSGMVLELPRCEGRSSLPPFHLTVSKYNLAQMHIPCQQSREPTILLNIVPNFWLSFASSSVRAAVASVVLMLLWGTLYFGEASLYRKLIKGNRQVRDGNIDSLGISSALRTLKHKRY
jgi:hypothetical protein